MEKSEEHRGKSIVVELKVRRRVVHTTASTKKMRRDNVEADVRSEKD